MNKNLKKILITVLITILLIFISIKGYTILNGLKGPSVKKEYKIIIEKYAEEYLTKKYGKHNFKVTRIDYDFHMDYVFDYSNPIGYWVDFKSDIVPKCWLVIKGLKPEDFTVSNDYFIEGYYFPDKDGYVVYNKMNEMKPKAELEKNLLNELQKEFSSDIYELDCDTIQLDIPNDYGRIPTLDELKTNTNLYKVTSFNYKVSNTITNTEEYKRNLKNYLLEKYDYNTVNIYVEDNNKKVSIYLFD